MKQFKPIIWGIAIIAFGLIIGGNALGIFNFDLFFDGWWTLFIIVPSFISLITDSEKLSSLGFLATGIILLLAAQDIFSYDVAWKTILAVFLVLIGLTIIIKNTYHSKNDKEIEKKIKDLKDDKSMDSQVAVFSGSDRIYNDEVFNGANLTAIFGGVDLDLLKAKFTKDVAIKAVCWFGGIDIIVPDDVQVKVKSDFIFGGITDERKGSDKEKGKYTIYLDVTGGFGGLCISDKPKK